MYAHSTSDASKIPITSLDIDVCMCLFHGIVFCVDGCDGLRFNDNFLLHTMHSSTVSVQVALKVVRDHTQLFRRGDKINFAE